MKKKIFGILIMTLLITPIAIGSIEEQKEETENSTIENINTNWEKQVTLHGDYTGSGSYQNGAIFGECDSASDGADAWDMPFPNLDPKFAIYMLEGTRYLLRDYHLGPKENRGGSGDPVGDMWTFRVWSLDTTQVTISWDKNALAGFGYNVHMIDIPAIAGFTRMEDCSSVSYTHYAGEFVTGEIGLQYSAPPERPEKPSGPSNLQKSENGEFSTVTTDPTNSWVRYQFKWGDGTESQWSDGVNSGERFYVDHSWSQPGTYTVQARARDKYFARSDWSPGFQVTVTEEQTGSPPEVPEILDAPSLMQYGETYEFTAVTTDQDDDDVQYGFTWDYADETWELLETEFMESGEPVTVQKSFESPGYTQFISMDVGAVDTNGLASEFCEPITIEISDPPEQVFITGQRSGTAGEEYTYEIRGYDPNPNDLVYFEIDWDDDQTTTTDEVPIMSAVNISHTWADQGDYVITATVYDSSSIEGPTTTLRVSMPKVKTHRWFHPWLSGLFERFPFFEPLLQQILGLQ